MNLSADRHVQRGSSGGGGAPADAAVHAEVDQARHEDDRHLREARVDGPGSNRYKTILSHPV